MKQTSLEERIEQWPELWKEARLRLLDAEVRVDVIDEAEAGKMAIAKAQLYRERIELEYVEKLGQTLRMLVELRKSEQTQPAE